MSTELVKADAYAKASLDERRAYVSAIAQAGDLLPQSLWSKPQPDGQGGMTRPAPSPAKVLLLAETGSMLGLHPMAALQSIHIIEGKPTLSANLLAALVRRAGHRLRVTTSGDWKAGTFVARAVLIRSDDPDFEFIVEWTKERATTAGLAGKGNWNKYPEAMCKARAITEVIREGAPDVTIVAAYTPEELGAAEVTEDGEVVELKPSQPEQASAPVAPVPEPEPPAPPTPEVRQPSRDWLVDANAAKSRDELRPVYVAAQEAGDLDVAIADGRTLKEYLWALRESLPETVEDIVDAEVVEDAPTEQTADWPVADIPNGDES